MNDLAVGVSGSACAAPVDRKRAVRRAPPSEEPLQAREKAARDMAAIAANKQFVGQRVNGPVQRHTRAALLTQSSPLPSRARQGSDKTSDGFGVGGSVRM